MGCTQQNSSSQSTMGNIAHVYVSVHSIQEAIQALFCQPSLGSDAASISILIHHNIVKASSPTNS
eukprot:1146135-Pelagomonas_calceolata.AAC.13